MNWYKLAQQAWAVRCPKCHKEWHVSQDTPGWIDARNKQMQGRTAKVICDDCLRSARKPPAV